MARELTEPAKELLPLVRQRLGDRQLRSNPKSETELTLLMESSDSELTMLRPSSTAARDS